MRLAPLRSALAVIFLASASNAADPRPLKVEDLFALKSVGAPVLSPDGAYVAYTVRSMDLKKDKSDADIYLIPTAGGEAVRRACRATMPVRARTLLALQALSSRLVETAGRSTARNLDLAFRHGDSREFEGEAPRVALVRGFGVHSSLRESARHWINGSTTEDVDQRGGSPKTHLRASLFALG